MDARSISGKWVVRGGMTLTFGAMAGAAVAGALRAADWVAPLGLVFILGLMFWIVGLFRRADEAAHRLARRRFSWCARCGYPFDERLPDDAQVMCSECGKEIYVGAEREWLRMYPERLSK